METLDLSQLGGIPFTQDLADIMQRGYVNSFIGLASIFGNSGGAAQILSGMEENVVSGGGTDTVSVSDGWFLYNNEVIKFTDNPTPQTRPTGGTDITLIRISGDTAVPLSLPYYNVSTPPVYRNTTATNELGASWSGFFLIPLRDFGKASQSLGEESRELFFHNMAVNIPGIAASNPTLSGNIKYKKDWLKNTVRVVIDVIVSDLAFVAGTVITNMNIGTLPTGFTPDRATYKNASCYTSNITDSGGSRLVALLALFDTTGDLTIDVSDSAGNVDYAFYMDEEFALS